MQEININIKSIGINALSIYRNTGLIKTSQLKREQKTYLRYIRRLYKKTNKLRETDKNLSLPVHFEWITDNYYIIEHEIKGIIKSLSFVNKLPGVKSVRQKNAEIKNKIKIYAFISELVMNFDGEVTVPMLGDYIQSAQSDDNYFSIPELSLIKVMLSASICEKIYTIALELDDYLNEKKDKMDEFYAYSLGYCIKNLRFCINSDFEPLFISISRTEKTLNLDPAGVYESMDKQTKIYYRKRITEIAAREEKSEIEVVEKIYSKAQKEKSNFIFTEEKDKIINQKKSHIGYYLLNKKTPRKAYFVNTTLLFSLFCIIFFNVSNAAFLFLIFAFFELSRQINDILFSRITENTTLPKLELKEIPSDKKVLVTITTLLFGAEKDAGLFKRLELYYLRNKEKNITFSILGDLKDNKNSTEDKDNDIISNAKKQIQSLNEKYGDIFALFIRERVYCSCEKRYMGWERKRGALIELVRYIKNKRTTITTVCGNVDNIRESRYVITLDGDTNLGIDNVRDMLSYMLHPYATPVFDEKKKIVTDGYGIMQPKIGTDLVSAVRTKFTRLQCGSGGVDIYASAAFDLYQEIYKEGNFCGKGIFDVDIYYKTIDKAYPEQSVLSHDLIEGTRLRTALVNDLELTDGIPKTAAAFFDRMHRWIRGDVQALAFAGKYVKDSDNTEIKNPISTLSKYKIIDNVRRAALPFFTVAAISVSLIFDRGRTPLYVFMLAFSYILFPMVFNIISLFLISSYQNVTKKFSSKVMTSIWKYITGTLYDVISLAHRAVISFDAIITTLFRMLISKKHLLSWTTASESEFKLSGFALYIKKMFISVIIGGVLVFFAPYGIYKLTGFLWLVFPVYAYYISKDEKPDNNPNKEKRIKETLFSYVGDMWKFYTISVTKEDNWLPPDNIQFFPVEVTAHRTSPTNIGLYLLSSLAAYDFKILDIKSLLVKVELVLITLSKLEKWNGHLYNWYDTKTLQIIGSKFISTVDSGNFIASLSTLKEGLQCISSEENSSQIKKICEKIENIISATDFYTLYNKKRELFYIGYDSDEKSYGENCYDLYMSESKITSYYAIAKKYVPKKHWQKLGRTLIKEKGYMGLASWTGTAFEYFMPNLFLPLYKDSLTYEAHKFAVREQIKKRAYYKDTEIWGTSESGFYAFDFDMNYQYQAFGVQKLGLKRGLNKDIVISPYSSFLSLSIAPYHAVSNLKKLEKIGLYGRYGFYESCDFTPSRVGNGIGIVKSYMAHHVGMSIVAAANFVFDNIFVKRFMSDKETESASELLQEKIPVDAVIFDDINTRSIPEKINRTYAVNSKDNERIDFLNPVCKMLSNSKSKIIASSIGHILLADGDITLNYCDFDKFNNKKILFALIKYDDKIISPAKILINDENGEYKFESDDKNIRYSVNLKSENGKEILYQKYEMNLSVLHDLSCFKVNINAEINDIKSSEQKLKNKTAPPEALFYFEPILAKLADYEAHPAFSSLSIEAEFEEKNNILYFKKRPRLEGESEKWLGIYVCHTDIKQKTIIPDKFRFESRKDSLVPIGYEKEDLISIIDKDLMNTSGACIQPVCVIKTTLRHSEKNKYAADILIASANKKEEIEYIIKQAIKRDTAKEEQNFENINKNLLYISKIANDEKKLSDIILSSIYCKTLYNRPSKTDITGLSTSIKILWKEGISGDLPIILIILSDNEKADIISKFLHIYKYLSLSSQKIDLVIIYDEKEKYNRPTQSSIREQLKNNGCDIFINKKGGIFLLNKGSLDINQTQLLNCMASYRHEIKDEILNTFLINDKIELGVMPPEICGNAQDKYIVEADDEKSVLNVHGGRFTDETFIIDQTPKHAPWSHIISNKQFGTLLTDKSLGFTWYMNSRERRMTAWKNDPVADMDSEILVLIYKDKKYDMVKLSSQLEISPNFAVYTGKIFDVQYDVRITVDHILPLKLLKVSLHSHTPEEVEICYMVKPVMGVAPVRYNFINITDKKHDTITFKNACNNDFYGYTGFIKAIGGKVRAHNKLEFLSDSKVQTDENDYICVSKFISKEDESKKTAEFILGCYRGELHYNYIEQKLSDQSYLRDMPLRARKFIKSYMPEIKLTSEYKAFDVMFNTFIPYQNIAGRILGRTGFYQSSGAFGFRDQLQDMTGLLYSSPQTVKAHIIRSAMHQFYEGDVQHWWHGIKSHDSGENKAHRGVRTRCSDDYLWLPYVTALYVKKTGDKDILKIKTAYIEDAVLRENEKERYSEPNKSQIKESLYEHCKKSIKYGLKYGSHGLPLIGTCDWNDGFSLVGEKGKGESVWLAWFLILVLHEFTEIARIMDDVESINLCRTEIDKIHGSINKHCYENNRYIRGFYDNGEKLGAESCDECKIDILPQAFSAIIGNMENNIDERTISALDSAYKNLYDSKYKILKLFTPPFVNGRQNPGYIKGYVAGIRENGGQYTHGAMWGGLGFLSAGQNERGYEILSALNPAVRCQDGELSEIYKIEPYVLSGDIYANPAHTGRGGWSWYTGAASWFYRIILENLLGINIDSKSISINPALSEKFNSYKIDIKIKDGIYHIDVSSGSEKVFLADGIKSQNPITLSSGEHQVKIVL